MDGARGNEVRVDILYASFVEVCVGFSKGERVGGEEGLVWLASWERELGGEGCGGPVDFAAGDGSCRGAGGC